MQVIRTVVWIAITALLVAFVAMNWEHAPVNFWPLAEGYLHFEWPVGVIAVFFFILGIVPMWMLHRAAMWRMTRRIAMLENNARVAAAALASPGAPPAPAPAPPLATATQLEAAKPEEPAA